MAGSGFASCAFCACCVLRRIGLARIVAEASRRSGIPVQHIWEMAGPVSQAAAFITTRTLVFTRPLVDRLSDAEMESVCLHELAHLSEPKAIIRLRRLAHLSRAPLLFAVPVVTRFGPDAVFALVLPVIVGPFALLRMQRRMEQRADRMAVEATTDPAVYARALEKLHESNQVPAVLSGAGRGTHPNLYDRMEAAGIAPDYPRPAKPKRFHWTSGVLLILGMAAFVQFVVLA
jgi:Zn-dependent protease with chaperone function